MSCRLIIPLLLGAIVGLSACGNSAPLGEEPVVTPTTVEEVGEGDGPDPGDVISATGVVRYVDLEGGFYGLITRNAGRYLPQNLPDSLKQDGLEVRFRGTPREDVATIQQWGTPIELIEIMRVRVMDNE